MKLLLLLDFKLLFFELELPFGQVPNQSVLDVLCRLFEFICFDFDEFAFDTREL